MKLETFFESFAPLADAPNGVQKLRELILQLAVQGKLMPQNADDEPAAVLLAKIKAEKERLIREKKIKKSESLPPIKADEVLFDLPEGWELVRLGEITESMTNGIYKPDSFYTSDGVGCLRMYNIDAGCINFLNLKKIRLTSAELQQYKLEPHDLLVNRVNSRELVGKAAVIPATPYPLIFESKNIRVKFLIKDRAFSEYVSLYFRTRYVRTVFEGDAKQTTGQASISQPQVANIIFPLPPLDEIGRIVAKVDQLMALCDQLEARQQRQQTARVKLNNAALEGLLTARAPAEFAEHWQRICDNFDLLYDAPETVSQLRQAMLQLAVQGKLAPQDASDEPAAVLLSKIRAEKERLIKEKKIKRSEPLLPIGADEVPFDLPIGWEWVRFPEVVFFQEGPGIRNWQFTNSGIKLLNVKNLVKGKLVLDNSDKYISVEEFHQKYSHFKIEEGDLLFASSGNSWGKTAFFEDPGYPVIVNTSTIRLRFFDPSCENVFLRYFLDSLFFRVQLESQLQGMQPNFGPLHLKKVLLPFPPSAEQRRIVAKVDQLMALCDELETKLRQAQTASAKLMTATVQHLATA